MQELTVEDFDAIVSGTVPVLVEFYAVWSRSDAALVRRLREWEEHFGDQIAFWRLNVDDHPQLTRRLGIFLTPVVGLWQAGKELVRRRGMVLDGAMLREVYRVVEKPLGNASANRYGKENENDRPK